jgi:sulfoxide reductase heme-binding subunit YedZ
MAASFLGISAPWRNPAGRVSAFKIVVLLLVLLPGLWFAWSWHVGDLGGRPVNNAVRGIGDWVIRFLLITLALSPMRVVLDWGRLVQLRRLLGVTTAIYALIHITLYNYEESWRVLFVISEIIHRFYLTIGFFALTGLVVLAVTSTNRWQSRLGRRWKTLHRLVFPICALALFHYMLQSKASVDGPMLAVGVFAWLGFWRLAPRRLQARLWLLPALTVLATATTALVEFAWYALATGVNAERVFMANFDISFGPRPAVQVLLLGLLVWLVAAIRRVWPKRARAKRVRARRGEVEQIGAGEGA